MATKKQGQETAEPMIRLGDQWIPAHDLWDKMETANVVADAIERFNESFPNLSNADTRDVVPLVRKRLKDIDLRMPRDPQLPDAAPIAIDLLKSMTPEDVIETLREQHNIETDMVQLIQLAGEQAYTAALVREANEFALNMISPDQTAQLWNDFARPCPGGGLWMANKVQDLLDENPD